MFLLFSMKKLKIKFLIHHFAYWTLIFSMVVAGILKLYNPYQFIPSQSLLPITSELSLFISALPLSIFEILLASVFLIKKDTNGINYTLIIMYSAFFILCCIVNFIGIEPDLICLERMASKQNLTLIIFKNFILVISSIVMLKTQN